MTQPDNTLGRLAPGRVLVGRYVVEELIGRGGMAEVYRGRDTRLARPVALKVLRAQFADDPALRIRFEEEAKAAALVSHPNVVGVYDAGEDSEEPSDQTAGRQQQAFIVMELVIGESLADRIVRGPLDSADARRIGCEILDALSAAHAKGVLHRDIKPANVLLTSDGIAKVADFGIAKAVQPSPESNDPPTEMNVVLGTPGYLAPERAQGSPATVRSDLWSVGVLLYEAMTGARPFAGDNAIAVTLAAQEGRYEPLLERRPDADRAVAAVVQRALEPDPASRFASAAEMAQALSLPAIGTIASDTARLTAAGGLAAGGLGGAGGLAAGGLGEAGAAAAFGTTRALGAPPGAAHTGAAPPGWVAGGNVVGEDYDSPGFKPSRPGAAVLVAAAIVVLIAGIVAIVLSLGHSSSPPPTPIATTTTKAPPSSTTTSSTAPPSSTTSTTSSSTTSTTSSSTTSTTSSTTSSSTSSTTTTGPTTTTVPTTTTLPATTTLPTTTTVPTTTTAGAQINRAQGR